jgi:hypothetical protein
MVIGVIVDVMTKESRDGFMPEESRDGFMPDADK